jgi:hypothetical protein
VPRRRAPAPALAPAVIAPREGPSPAAPPARAEHWPPRAVALLLSCLAMAVYCANGRSIPSGDTISTALVPIEVLNHGDLQMRAFARYYRLRSTRTYFFTWTRRHGWVPTYPIATALVLTPLYAAPVWICRRSGPSTADWVHFANVAEKPAAALVAAAAAAVFYLLALRLGAGRRWAVALTLAAAFGTEAWSTSSQALWQHGMGVLAILVASLLALRQRESPSVATAFACGAACALAVAVRPTNLAFALPLWSWVALRRSPRFAAHLAAAAAAPVLAGSALVAYNLTLFQRLAGGYAWTPSPSIPAALAGLLASPGRGLFIYCPLAAVGVVGAVRALRRHGLLSTIYGPWALFAAAQLLLVAAFANWWGGFCYGPRQLSEIQPLLLLLWIPLLPAAADRDAAPAEPGAGGRRPAAAAVDLVPQTGTAKESARRAIREGARRATKERERRAARKSARWATRESAWRATREGARRAASTGWLGWAFWALFAWSAALQAVGAFCYTGQWNASPAAIDSSPQRLWDWRDNPVSRDLAAAVKPPATAPAAPAAMDARP